MVSFYPFNEYGIMPQVYKEGHLQDYFLTNFPNTKMVTENKNILQRIAIGL